MRNLLDPQQHSALLFHHYFCLAELSRITFDCPFSKSCLLNLTLTLNKPCDSSMFYFLKLPSPQKLLFLGSNNTCYNATNEREFPREEWHSFNHFPYTEYHSVNY
ncbi:hypothetical protein SAY87_020596 [Trapa incisa]|uniref:Uncharacterized protein n=1 Tax=Trapa incisa TaxID=236973 RepID=A0AAN7JQZ4_9MYRT|nr:hypothetical protein SAY87_020596 [Trapa incisa]